MSIYPRIQKSTSGAFNNHDVISNTEPSLFNLDLSNFVLKTAPVFDRTVFFTHDAKLNFDGEEGTAYSIIERNKNDSNKNKTTHIEFNSNTTHIDGNLNLTQANVLLTNESIPIIKITNLSDKLTEIDENLAAIIQNDEELLHLHNVTDNHTLRLNAVDVSNNLQFTSINNIELDINNVVKPSIDAVEIDVVDILAHNLIQDGKLLDNENLLDTHIDNLIEIEQNLNSTLNSLNDYKIKTDASMVTVSSNILTNTINIGNHAILIDSANTLNIVQNERLSTNDNLLAIHDNSLNLLLAKIKFMMQV